MNRAIWRATIVGALALTTVAGAGSAVASGGATSTVDQATAEEYVVLATDTTTLADAQAAVEAAGGQVIEVNADIGLLTVKSSDAGFSAVVRSSASVSGVARNRPIGEAPAESRKKREEVEKVTAERAAAAGPRQAARPSAPKGEPLSDLQWDMAMIGATPDGSYAINPGKKGVTVGIIDTGIDGTHPDIRPNFDGKLSRNFTVDIPLIDGPCEDEPDKSCNDPANVDEDGHGTHVAGTVAGAINGKGIAGVAPNVTLVNLRAGQDSGYFFLAATVDALTYAGKNGIDVVNMSFFTDPWLYNCAANPADSPDAQAEQRTIIEATQRAVRFARRNGVTLVSALGNENTNIDNPTIDVISPDFPPGTEYERQVDNSCLTMPTEADGVVGVSSIGPSGKKADYSNWGLDQADLSAPGGFFRDYIDDPALNRRPENLVLAPYPWVDAQSQGFVDPVTGESIDPFVISDCKGATPKSCTYWQYLQGTSMASPHAAGVAALVVSAHGHRDPVHGGLTMDPGEVERIMRQTAIKTPCPDVNPITYIAEGRDDSYTALCEGTKNDNSIYGHGIVSALGAVR